MNDKATSEDYDSLISQVDKVINNNEENKIDIIITKIKSSKWTFLFIIMTILIMIIHMLLVPTNSDNSSPLPVTQMLVYCYFGLKNIYYI